MGKDTFTKRFLDLIPIRGRTEHTKDEVPVREWSGATQHTVKSRLYVIIQSKEVDRDINAGGYRLKRIAGLDNAIPPRSWYRQTA